MSFGEIGYKQLITNSNNVRAVEMNNLALFPAQMLETIDKLDLEEVRLGMMDILTKREIDMLCTRIIELRAVIQKARNDRKVKVGELEERILNDPDLGPLWTLYTFKDKLVNVYVGGNKAKDHYLDRHSYINDEHVPPKNVLKAKIQELLKEKSIDVTGAKFRILAELK